MSCAYGQDLAFCCSKTYQGYTENGDPLVKFLDSMKHVTEPIYENQKLSKRKTDLELKQSNCGSSQVTSLLFDLLHQHV